MIDQCGIGQFLAARVNDFPVFRFAATRVGIPDLGSGLNQHGTGAGAGLAQRHPERPDGIRITCDLDSERRIGVQLIVGGSGLQDHVLEWDVELLGQYHRYRRVDALPHFHLGHDQRHHTLAVYPDECVRLEALPTALRGLAWSTSANNWQVETHHKRASGSSSCFENGPPAGICKLRRPWRGHVLAPDARLIASRIRTYVPHRQIFPAIAALMSASVGWGVPFNKAVADMICPDWQYPHCTTSSSSQAFCTWAPAGVAPTPSIVVMARLPTALTGKRHERTGLPSRWTVQAPHWPIPHPNLVPVRPTTSRSTHRRGISPGAS